MKHLAFLLIYLLAAGMPIFAAEGAPKVVLETSAGKVTIELYPAKAPASVKNFLSYVRSGFYDGTIFHRVIPGFMIQGGGFTPAMAQKPTAAAIKNEADNGLKNDRGAVSMARTRDPHSASSQFFINTVNNDFLNYRGRTMEGWGYAVFGKIVEGMDVVDAISKVKTGSHGMFRDVPLEPVVIHRACVL